MNKFVYGGILPYAKHKGNTYYLIGQEDLGRDKGKWSDFGGRADKEDVSPLGVALRESTEESMGFLEPLQTPTKFLSRKSDPGGRVSRTYLMQVAYDPLLPSRFAKKRRLLRRHLPSFLREKRRVKWVKAEDIKKCRLRWFFRDLF